MAQPPYDRRVILVDESNNPWNIGNPLPVTGIGASGTFSSEMVSGSMVVNGVSTTLKHAVVDHAATTSAVFQLVAAVPLKRIRVVGFYIFARLATGIQWYSAASIVIPTMDVSGKILTGANFAPGYWMQTAVGEALQWQQIGTFTTIRGVLNYLEVS